MDITINEWLFYYLSDIEKYSIAVKVLNRLYNKCDRIVYAKGSPMSNKINQLSKFGLPKQRNAIKDFFRKFSYNSEKMLIIDTELPNLPNDLVSILPRRETDKDIYLVQTCLATADKIILTIDEDLKKALNDKFGIKVKLVSEFLEES
jgi:hypothetical protein